jgi:hypothetical protein
MGASEGLGGPNKADPHVPPAQGDNIHQEWGFVAQGLRGIGRQQGETKKCDYHVVWFLPLCVGTRRRGGGGMWRAIWKEGVKGSENSRNGLHIGKRRGPPRRGGSIGHGR